MSRQKPDWYRERWRKICREQGTLPHWWQWWGPTPPNKQQVSAAPPSARLRELELALTKVRPLESQFGSQKAFHDVIDWIEEIQLDLLEDQEFREYVRRLDPSILTMTAWKDFYSR